MDDALLNQRCPFELSEIFCWEKEEESLESSFIVLILDHMEGEKHECLKNTKRVDQAIIQPFMYIFI